MEPITNTIVAAIVAGAAAASKHVATSTIIDAYTAIKRLIADRYKRASVFVEAVEDDPMSQPQQQALAKQLFKADVGNDPELRDSAQQLLKELEAMCAESKAAALFDFDRLHAAGKFELEDVHSISTVLRASEAKFEKDFKATGIRQKH